MQENDIFIDHKYCSYCKYCVYRLPAVWFVCLGYASVKFSLQSNYDTTSNCQTAFDQNLSLYFGKVRGLRKKLSNILVQKGGDPKDFAPNIEVQKLWAENSSEPEVRQTWD